MERGVAITLVIVAMVLVFGVLVYVLFSQNIFITNTIDDSSENNQNTYSSSNSNNPEVIIVDTAKDNTVQNYIYGYYNNIGYQSYLTDRYGNMVYLPMERQGYYNGMYIENGFRCYDYYNDYDRIMRTHCTKNRNYDRRYS